ncbi:SoxR reducing system RseC family protein [Motiliproteus sediminis]|uniref:SoxR reducing system RseC family protein n=1 Tax=Motiliproteus sediminis TaxID=1468178 RepID=UPI001AEF8BE4|nr:SoxR reducing system RseC family protein [Motiliproteus sediminis]
MLEESAQVIEAADGGVWVETVRQSACSSCSARKGCGQKLLSDIGQGARFRVLARNPRQLVLSPGDPVVLGLAESSLLTASALVYLLPLVTMAVAAVVAQWSGAAEGLVALAGMVGLGLGLLGVRHWGPGRSQDCRYQPEVLRKAA